MKNNNKSVFFLLLPAFIFIIIFSLWPVLQSGIYSLFDYQLNDQTKSRLSFNEQLNVGKVVETNQYIDFYLSNELETAEKEQTKKDIEAAMKRTKEFEDVFGQKYKEEIVKLSKADKNYLLNEFLEIEEIVNKVYENEDEGLYIEDDIKAVVGGYMTSLIEPNFIGLRNYTDALKDKRVQDSLVNTAVFTFFSVGLELIFGILLALIMNKSLKGKSIIRTLSLIPWAIPTVVSALLWLYLYNGSSGIIAQLFSNIGIVKQPTDLLLTGNAAMFAVIIADVWKTTPYMALLVLAGLQTIPSSVYEASSVDGANKIQQFFKITLPMLKSSILVALLFRTLDAFRVFDLIYVLTGGGPGGSTESISIYAYKVMFAQTKFGYGSALTIIIAICVAIISFFYIKVLDVDIASREG